MAEWPATEKLVWRARVAGGSVRGRAPLDADRAWCVASAPEREQVALAARALERRRAGALTQADPEYPSALRDLTDAPPVVFVYGAPVPRFERAVAVVGSRAASPYGVTHAHRLAADLAALGLTVVSGLARGIDAAAHRGALEANGRTIAVVPGGFDPVTPEHHQALAEEIAEHGSLVTEWPFALGFKHAFLRRNRLIAALACATIVVEAAERSGALSTAEAARRLGRVVLAVPGDLDRPTSRGCHALIKRGAKLCEGTADVLAAIPSLANSADSGEARLLAALAGGPRTAESAAGAAGVSMDQALAGLLRLEWAGVVTALPGQRWVRSADASA